MPYRSAHWLMLFGLLPAILLAFWPAYFGKLGQASFAFHAHGLTASAWLLLVGVQSWSIHTRRVALHRTLGLAVFVVVPLFVGGGVVAMQSMALKYVTASHPFYAALGPRLGLHDGVSIIALCGMVSAALAHRRRAATHGGYMLGTALLVLPPIVARLPIPIPPPLHPGEAIAILLALAIASRPRAARTPFLIVAAVMLLQIALFETFGASSVWAAIFAQIADMPAATLAIPAMLAALCTLLAVWFGSLGPRRAPMAAG